MRSGKLKVRCGPVRCGNDVLVFSIVKLSKKSMGGAFRSGAVRRPTTTTTVTAPHWLKKGRFYTGLGYYYPANHKTNRTNKLGSDFRDSVCVCKCIKHEVFYV